MFRVEICWRLENLYPAARKTHRKKLERERGTKEGEKDLDVETKGEICPRTTKRRAEVRRNCRPHLREENSGRGSSAGFPLSDRAA